jgi:hypothetical protein
MLSSTDCRCVERMRICRLWTSLACATPPMRSSSPSSPHTSFASSEFTARTLSRDCDSFTTQGRAAAQRSGNSTCNCTSDGVADGPPRAVVDAAHLRRALLHRLHHLRVVVVHSRQLRNNRLGVFPTRAAAIYMRAAGVHNSRFRTARHVSTAATIRTPAAARAHAHFHQTLQVSKARRADTQQNAQRGRHSQHNTSQTLVPNVGPEALTKATSTSVSRNRQRC